MRDKTKGGMSRVDTLPDGFDKLIGRTQLVVGEIVGGRFKLIKSLGSGGMGEVFVAENISIGMRVAIKVLKPELLANPEFRQRFQNEAQAVAAIEHANVARFFDLVVGDPTFIVMEYVRGETLADRMKLGALPVERALEYAERLSWGLDAAHAAGVVHRDLKPANVILAPDAEHGELPKLIDFGLAKLAAAAGDSQLTRTGQIIGTPAYMSPEQIKGDKIDGRADVYSLGCVLYEMLTGRTPFAGPADDDVQILYRQMHEAPPPLAKLMPDAPAPLEALLNKALQKDPALRFPSIRAMAAAIAEVAQALPRLYGVPSPRDHSGRVALTAQRLLDEQRRERMRTLGLTAAIVLFAGALVGGAALLRWRHAPATPRALLVVTSQPAGATVTVDGRVLDETTPTAMRDLPPGKHTVRIAKSGYAPVERTLTTAAADERASMDVALPPETRKVEVQTAPDGASLYVDGRLVPGTTPTTVALTIDDFHELRAERDGYETLVRALKPEDHDPVVTLMLQPERHPRGTLVVEAQDVAEVWLDGVPTGLTTPTLGFHVSVGEHTIELHTASGERSAPKKVRVAQGQTLRLSMALETKKTP